MRKRMGTVALLSVAGAALAWVSTTETKNGQRQISVVPGNPNQTTLIAEKSLLVAAGTERAAASTIGCQSTSSRYPWGSAAFRTWTPLNVGKSAGTPGSYDTSGTRTGNPFSARLIQAYGQDVGESRQSVVLEMPDGCRRQFRSSSFIAADVSFIRAEIDNHPSTSDPNSYAVSVAEQNLVSLDEIRSGAVRTYQTQHFNIMYGTKTRNFSYRHEASLNVPWNTFIAEVGRSFESAWQIDRLILEAPMPYSGSSGRKKINIYILRHRKAVHRKWRRYRLRRIRCRRHLRRCALRAGRIAHGHSRVRPCHTVLQRWISRSGQCRADLGNRRRMDGVYTITNGRILPGRISEQFGKRTALVQQSLRQLPLHVVPVRAGQDTTFPVVGLDRQLARRRGRIEGGLDRDVHSTGAGGWCLSLRLRFVRR